MTPIRILVSDPDGSFRVTMLEPDLEVFQDLVDGYIEGVTEPVDGNFGYINEEGKMRGLPSNHIASHFLDDRFVEAGRLPFTNHDFIVGPMVWCGPANGAGNDTSLPLRFIDQFARFTLTLRAEGACVVRSGQDVTIYTSGEDRTDEILSNILDRAEEVTLGRSVEVWPTALPDRLAALTADFLRADPDTRFTITD